MENQKSETGIGKPRQRMKRYFNKLKVDKYEYNSAMFYAWEQVRLNRLYPMMKPDVDQIRRYNKILRAHKINVRLT